SAAARPRRPNSCPRIPLTRPASPRSSNICEASAIRSETQKRPRKTGPFRFGDGGSAQAGAEALDALAGIRQLVYGCRIGDAEEGRETECRAMHNGNAFRLDQREREVFVALDHLAIRRCLADAAFAGRIDIEGTLGRRAFQTLRLIEHGDDKVAP